MRVNYSSFMTTEDPPVEISVNPLQVRYLKSAGENTQIHFAHDDMVVVGTAIKLVNRNRPIDA